MSDHYSVEFEDFDRLNLVQALRAFAKAYASDYYAHLIDSAADALERDEAVMRFTLNALYQDNPFGKQEAEAIEKLKAALE